MGRASSARPALEISITLDVDHRMRHTTPRAKQEAGSGDGGNNSGNDGDDMYD